MSEVISHVDWKLLREQKRCLVDVVNDRAIVTATQKEMLEGLINLLDAIQDEATEELSEETVFGKSEKEE